MQPNNSQVPYNQQGPYMPSTPDGPVFHSSGDVLPPGSLAVANPQHVPLFDLPLELFEMIVDHLETPEELFTLSTASRQLWNTCNSIEKYAFLDALKFQRRFDNRIGHDPAHIWQMYLRRHPNGPILSWLVRSNADLNTIARVAEINRNICPRALQGDTLLGMNPLVFLMIDCNRYDLIPAMAQHYHTLWTGRLFTDAHQKRWIERAACKCDDLFIIYWLLENYGVANQILTLDDLYMLEARGVIKRFDADWNRLEVYLPEDEILDRPEGTLPAHLMNHY